MKISNGIFGDTFSEGNERTFQKLKGSDFIQYYKGTA